MRCRVTKYSKPFFIFCCENVQFTVTVKYCTGPLEELLGGKEKVFGFFVGKMMRELKGKASPDAVREALVKEVERSRCC